jgi:hypothetical protein
MPARINPNRVAAPVAGLTENKSRPPTVLESTKIRLDLGSKAKFTWRSLKIPVSPITLAMPDDGLSEYRLPDSARMAKAVPVLGKTSIPMIWPRFVTRGLPARPVVGST